MASPTLVDPNLLQDQQEAQEFATLVKQFGGAFRGSFASVYRNNAGDHFRKLCTPLAVQFCLQPDFLSFIAMGGMKKCIDVFENNQALLGKAERLKGKLESLSEQYNTGNLGDEEKQALEQKYQKKQQKLQQIGSEIGLYTQHVLYEGRLADNRACPLDKSLEKFMIACLKQGKAALLIEGNGISHTLGIAVATQQVILFDPDNGFASFPSTAELGKFLEYFVKQKKGITQGRALLGLVG